MSMNDPLASVMSGILNHERSGKGTIFVRPDSKVIRMVLEIMNEEGYIGASEPVEDGRAGMLKVNLLGAINRCGTIKPRYAVRVGGFEKYEKRYLPAIDFGILIISTSKGLMTHQKAKKEGFGGKLIAYCY